MYGPGTIALIISNKEMNDMMKIIQVLVDYNILLKGVTKTIKNETKEHNMLLGTLGANCKSWFWLLFFELLQKRKRNCKSWLWKRMGLLMPSHPLTNFEIQKYYQNEPRFNGVFSKVICLKNEGWRIRNKP